MNTRPAMPRPQLLRAVGPARGDITMTDTAHPTPEKPADQDSETAAAPGGLRIQFNLKIVAIVLAIAVVECLAAWLYLPSAHEAAASAEDALRAVPPPPLPGEPVDEEKKLKEVSLGTFSVTSLQPLSNTVMRIDFKLYGAIIDDETTEPEFTDRFAKHEHRFRDQVLVIVRSSDVKDLTDPGLGLIKRRILETVNQTLDKPLVESVAFSDFSIIEQ